MPRRTRPWEVVLAITIMLALLVALIALVAGGSTDTLGLAVVLLVTVGLVGLILGVASWWATGE